MASNDGRSDRFHQAKKVSRFYHATGLRPVAGFQALSCLGGRLTEYLKAEYLVGTFGAVKAELFQTGGSGFQKNAVSATGLKYLVSRCADCPAGKPSSQLG